MSSFRINNKSCSSIHFTGIFGSGMSALAQFLRWEGCDVSGSDRLLGSADTGEIHSLLVKVGCRVGEQNGSLVSPETDALCVSTAIEDGNPDIAAARAHNVMIVHRSDVLAAIVASRKTIAVAGTSGKSTVTAMIFEFLTRCGKSPSLLSGANLRRLERSGLIGNAYKGESDLLVIEADESDGTIIKYQPYISVFLNVSKDHKPVNETIELFKTLAARSGACIRNNDDPNLACLPASETFGISSSASIRPDSVEYSQLSSRFTVGGTTFELPIPGAYNVINCLAALSACKCIGCTDTDLSCAVKEYHGVARRFEIMRTGQGVTVVDDFAHNPEKILAAVATARNLSSRLTVIYQPHGFGPTRFLQNEFAEAFRRILTGVDTLFLLPIYYAGGTARKDISSADIIRLIGSVPFSATAPSGRDVVLKEITSKVRKGDCVLLMGARDPSLSSFARQIVDSLGGPYSA